jgi:uncharacterized membrane protein YcaP (DUF421 family)
MFLCKYAKSLGEVGKGIHSYRIFDIAYMDVLATILGAFILSHIFKIRFVYTLVVLFLVGIILHRLFCVRTTIDKLLFSNPP